ncbi:MAG: histidine phosphatase family protein [Acidimicrobiales bacterium]
MSAHVLLVRHATTADTRAGRFSGPEPTPLDTAGRAQAAAVGTALADRRIGAVLTSPVARPWRRQHVRASRTPKRVGALVEWDYGTLVGRVAADVRWRPGVVAVARRRARGESPAEVEQRLDRVVDRLVSAVDGLRPDATGGDLVVVAHGHLLRALIARWLGLAMHDAGGFVVDPASISELSVHHGRRALARLNDCGHLGATR